MSDFDHSRDGKAPSFETLHKTPQNSRVEDSSSVLAPMEMTPRDHGASVSPPGHNHPATTQVTESSLLEHPPVPVIPVEDPAAQAPVERTLNVADALGYLDAVKTQFNDRPDVYNQFLDIMKEFKGQYIDTPGVIKRVSSLFNGHPVLIQGFNTFLPAGYRIECSKDANNSSYITVTTPTGTTTTTTTTSRPPPLPVTADGRAATPERLSSRHPSVEPPREKQAIEPAVTYVHKIKQQCDPETYRQFLDILSRYHHQPGNIDEEEVTAQIAFLFKDSPELQKDFALFLPDRGKPQDDSSHSEKSRQRRTETATPATVLSHKRKRREVVEIVPKVAPSKRQNKKAKQADPAPTQTQPPVRMSSPVRRQPVSRPTTSSSALPAAPEDSPAHIFFDRVKRALDDNRETYNEFLKLINLFTQDFIDTPRLVRESRSFLGDGELMVMLKEIVGWDDRREKESRMEGGSWTRPAIVNRKVDKSQARLNAEFGSYRRIPDADANVVCSGRDEMCRQVLNDSWVSHPTWTSEEVGFVTPRMNLYEEALHRSEEERLEYDFHIEAIVRTISMLEPLNMKMAALTVEDRAAFKPKPNLNGQLKSIHHRAMQDTPALAIPVVLQRLKQKEEEWKRGQREWNKVWREVDARNYSKSLDHQAIQFKVRDKKALTSKSFVSQIETAREEQVTRRAALIDPLFARTRPRHQLEFVMDDTVVLQDALKLTFSFLDRAQGQINFSERKRIEGFLRNFVPLFYGLDAAAFNAAFVVVQPSPESDLSDEDTDTYSVSSSSRLRPSHAGDLRKQLLKSEQAKLSHRSTRNNDSPASTRPPSPVSEAESSRAASIRGTFFTNTMFYTLLRLIEVLFSRLKLLKDVAAGLLTRDMSSVPRDPGAFAHQEIVPFRDLSSHAEHFYNIMLESCERLFDNEMEQHVFEDQMRFMFGIKHAHKIFTVDKVAGVQVILGDSQSQDLLELFKRERALTSSTTQDLVNSRKNAEKILGPDENLFRVDWVSAASRMTIQLIGKDDSSFDDSEVLNGRWQSYMESFVTTNVSDGVTAARVRRPFLRRNISTGPAVPKMLTRDGLEIKICVRTYRLFYGSQTEDWLFKTDSRGKLSSLVEKKAVRRKLWLEKEAV
ncbi:unnamed protein product [Mycena citricolor]|uniref:Histone deacetylase interacting domain-containing protein n=1 Tax=Mycena citricolor TaxID=2018698 RepID=A0AAD2H5Y6_9AGAR|nr:unnamed protein product [Mycena citricolor]